MFLKKEDLINGSLNFKYHGHVGPVEKKKKDGGSWSAYTFDLEIDGKRYQYDIRSQSAEYGGGEAIVEAQRFDTVQAFMNGEWINWKMIPRESEPSDVRSHASENKAEIKSEKAFTNGQDRKGDEIALLALTKSWIESGKCEDSEGAGITALRSFRIYKEDLETISQEME